jgi:hypothetical protein
MTSCPGYETSPNLCTCPCEGCKHHCSAHGPVVLGDLTSKREDTVWTWVTNAWVALTGTSGYVAGEVVTRANGWPWWWEMLAAGVGVCVGLAVCSPPLLLAIHFRKRQLIRRAS